MTAERNAVVKRQWLKPQLTQISVTAPSVLLACSDPVNVGAGTTFPCVGFDNCCVDPARPEDCSAC